MVDSMTLVVVGLGIVALAVSFIEYALANKKRLKAEHAELK
jgi:hypothetical protein